MESVQIKKYFKTSIAKFLSEIRHCHSGEDAVCGPMLCDCVVLQIGYNFATYFVMSLKSCLLP